MKDFEFITEEEWEKYVRQPVDTSTVDCRFFFNKLLNKKAEKGFTSYPCTEYEKDFICRHLGWEPSKGLSDTHEAFVFLRPIEEEKPKCECETKRTKMTRNPQEDGSVILAHCEVDNKFCPECGEKLKGEE